jgi:prepilin-type N-terminal cleavage/methylation domain-containing protein
MVKRSATQRSGFTLLEMLLAAAIGVVLMGALYVAVEYQLRHTKAGRELVEHNLLGRAVLTRMAGEIKLCVGLYRSPAAANATSSNSSSSSSGSSNSSNSGSSGSTSGTSGSSSSSAASTAGVSTTAYNLGLQGDATHIVFLVSRVPSELYQLPPDSTANQVAPTGISDLRQVSYWLAGGTGDAQGLARRESKAVTSDDAVAAWTTTPDNPGAVIAEEVQDLHFRYFDGTTWQDNWDSTVLGPDGATPVGLPVAVEINLGIRPPTPAGTAGGSELKYYQHRVALPAANSASPPPTPTTTSP